MAREGSGVTYAERIKVGLKIWGPLKIIISKETLKLWERNNYMKASEDKDE
jgi:hypothetical protein